MAGFLIRRVLQFIPVFLLGAIAVWALIYALPGDPAEALAGLDATPEEIAAVRQRLGLDQPVWLQFLTWFGNVAVGDLGISSSSGFPVKDLLAKHIPASVQLAVLAMLIVIVIAIPLGTVKALAPHKLSGRIVNAYLSLSLATPPFWIGQLLIIAFAVGLRTLPAASRYVPFWDDPGQAFRNMLLPALALGIFSGGVLARYVAASLSDAMESDYVRTARSKGASETRVVLHHAMRNSMLPVLTVAALQLGSLMSGAVVMEVLFTYSGIGRLLFEAIRTRDYAVMQASILLILVLYLVISLLVDILYAALDPRIRVK